MSEGHLQARKAMANAQARTSIFWIQCSMLHGWNGERL